MLLLHGEYGFASRLGYLVDLQKLCFSSNPKEKNHMA
jgi:hypothetical protein